MQTERGAPKRGVGSTSRPVDDGAALPGTSSRDSVVTIEEGTTTTRSTLPAKRGPGKDEKHPAKRAPRPPIYRPLGSMVGCGFSEPATGEICEAESALACGNVCCKTRVCQRHFDKANGVCMTCLLKFGAKTTYSRDKGKPEPIFKGREEDGRPVMMSAVPLPKEVQVPSIHG